MSRAVTVRRCATLNEAHIVCGLLRARGFDATVEEANHAANDWFVVQAIGGVRVSVPEPQLEAASRLIADVISASQLSADPLERTAPRKTSSRWTAIISMWIIYLGIPAGAALLGVRLIQIFNGP